MDINRLVENKVDLDKFLYTRSVLYNLEPIGVGTPYVESLSSYISRLAFVHNVSVSNLLKGVLISCLNKEYIKKEIKMGITKGTSRFINENSILSRDYVYALESLTGRRDLLNLTMLNWKGIFSRNIRSSYRKWCPLCLNQMKLESKDIYEPLIWCLSDIKKCDIHETSLQGECPSCNKKLPFLHSKYLVGYCQYCESWLGNQGTFSKETLTKEEEFIMLNYKQLIENTPNLTFFPSNNYFVGILNKIEKEIGFKTKRGFASFLEYNTTTVYEWKLNRYLPSHTTLLGILQKLNKTIYELIYKKDIRFDIDVKKYNYTKSISASKNEIEYHLKNALKFDEPKSLYIIAREVGFASETAQRNFPLLCEGIKERHESFKKQFKIQKQQEIEAMLNECLARAKPISFAHFLKESRFSHRAARKYAPELCKKVSLRYKKYLAELKKKRIEENLKIIQKAAIKLHQAGIYPSISKLQREMDNKSVFLESDIREGWRNIVKSLGYKLD